MTNNAQIILDHISFSYSEATEKKTFLLKEFSLNVKKGEYITIAGANGSGKTTLASMIKGLITPTSGEIYYNGKKVTGCGINSEIGYIFSNAENQIVSPVVEDDVAFGLENSGFNRQDMKGVVLSSLDKVDALNLQKELTHLLSGGEQQKVNIAGILALECKCIIFDEASSMLDPLSRRALLRLLKELNKQYKITIIQITHNLFELLNSDRVIYLYSGQILFDGKSEVFINNKSSCYSFGEKQRLLIEFIQKLEKITKDCSFYGWDLEDLVSHLSGLAEKK